MRISDHRYARDLRRYQLAWRMIRQGVRRRAISLWTGLSVYRIKTLYRSYASSGTSPQRGIAPYQVAQFWSSLQNRTETAVLAGFLSAYGVLPEAGADEERLHTLAGGELLCRAYEEFTAIWPMAQLRLEHGMLLLEELARGVEMELAQCPQCDALVVADRLSLGPPHCAFCFHELQNGRRYDRRVAWPTAAIGPEPWGPGAQRPLF